MNPELAACYQALEQAGSETDLGAMVLGIAKLLVRADLPERTIAALRRRRQVTGCLLTSCDIVVNQEQVQNHAPRVDPMQWRTPVELDVAVKVSNSATDNPRPRKSNSATPILLMQARAVQELSDCLPKL